MHSVAITGVGIVSCLGSGSGRVLDSLRAGRSGIRLDPRRTELGFRSALTGAIDDFVFPKLDRKRTRTLTTFGLQAYGAAVEAIEAAGWTDEDVRNARTGLIVGNDSSALASIEQAEITRREKSTFPIGGSLVFRALNSTVSMNLNTLLGNRGASWTLSGACASGSHAIGQAADLIALGRQDRVVCGGAQEINWESIASFDATNAFSTRQNAPEEASRPFDAGRDGLVPSGGAAMLALERGDLARQRGATILGWVRSYAFSSDGQNLAAPSGEGLRACMEECLSRAQVGTESVDCIAAHATSTPLGDAVEAGAIAQVFGEATGGKRVPWVVSFKGMVGHEMWMAGASQVVYTLLMARGGFIAANRNFERQEEGAARLRVVKEIVDTTPRWVLCNAAGFGGTNSCLLIETETATHAL